MAESLANRIANALTDDFIHSGKLQPGDRFPTVRQLEKVYGASRSTVVQALSILELRGLVDKRHGSGCYLTEGPADADSEPARLIGFVSSGTSDELSLRVADGIQRVCQRSGYHMLFASIGRNYDEERRQVERMRESGCEAIVVKPLERTREQLESDYLNIEHLDFPIVLVDMAHPSHERSQVVFDNYQVGYDMASMLIGEGHRRIAFMELNNANEDLCVVTNHERSRGYLDAMAAAGFLVHEEDKWVVHLGEVATYPTPQQAASFLMRWCDQVDRPTALMAIEDTMAVTIIGQARELGIAVPEELRVVGFDNLSVARCFTPLFPTTAPDFCKAGEMAVQQAIRQAKGESGHTRIFVLNAPVITRHTEPAVRRDSGSVATDTPGCQDYN
ncbi:MAG: GntR family transcriptional regulator [Armatimonadota bacterium]